MKRVARNPESRAENVDALLAAFFQAEMPTPWPPFQGGSRTLPMARPPRRSGWSSRLALVAAVVLLLLGAWLLPRPAQPGSAEQNGSLPALSEGTATGKHGLEKGGAPAKAAPRRLEQGNPRR